MVRKKTVKARLMELTREHERKLRPEQWRRERLQWEDWESLNRDAVELARIALKRHGRGMVLPGGYDAESLAAQAVADLMASKVRAPVAPTRERLVKKLDGLIQGKIRVLMMLKEASVTRSEWHSDGSSSLRGVKDEGVDVCEAVSSGEAEEARLCLKTEMQRSLEDEPELAALFVCRWKGMTNPVELARELGMTEEEVVRARKRLDRRLAAFGKGRVRLRQSQSRGDAGVCAT